jgi:hypothetical protein
VAIKTFKDAWREKDRYPPHGCSDRNYLAWEFVRRHPDYAEHAEQMLRLVNTGEYITGFKRSSLSILDGVECWPAANRGETVKQYVDRMKEEKVKRHRIDKPRNTFLNRWALDMPVDPATEYNFDTIKFIGHQVKIRRDKDQKSRSFNLFLYPNEIALRFRLDMSVAKQLVMAQERLKVEAKKYEAERPPLSVGMKGILVAKENSEMSEDALPCAHYWLRCYDAAHEPKKALSDDPKLRRASKSGEMQRMEEFNKEKKAAKQTDYVTAGTVKSYLSLARDYIEGKKFLLLLLADMTPGQGKKGG